MGPAIALTYFLAKPILRGNREDARCVRVGTGWIGVDAVRNGQMSILGRWFHLEAPAVARSPHSEKRTRSLAVYSRCNTDLFYAILFSISLPPTTSPLFLCPFLFP